MKEHSGQDEYLAVNPGMPAYFLTYIEMWKLGVLSLLG